MIRCGRLVSLATAGCQRWAAGLVPAWISSSAVAVDMCCCAALPAAAPYPTASSLFPPKAPESSRAGHGAKVFRNTWHNRYRSTISQRGASSLPQPPHLRAVDPSPGAAATPSSRLQFAEGEIQDIASTADAGPGADDAAQQQRSEFQDPALQAQANVEGPSQEDRGRRENSNLQERLFETALGHVVSVIQNSAKGSLGCFLNASW